MGKTMICKNCGKVFPNRIVIDGEKKDLYNRSFCLECSPFNQHNTKDITQKKYCVICGVELVNRQRFTCSPQCDNERKYITYIEKWKSGSVDGLRGEYQISNRIRRYLFEKYNNKCCRCGWGETNEYTGNIPLEVHHKDGNYKNNNEDNLELLCPNCHSLTDNYKCQNIGNGRKQRKKYT